MQLGRSDPLRGVKQILRFNWTRYAAAGVVMLIGGGALVALPWPAGWKLAAAVPLLMAAFWSVTSLAVSHSVYDRSDVSDWRILRELVATPSRWVHVHAGVDNATAHLHRLYPAADGVVLDIYDPAVMTEPSIRRTRGEATGATPAKYDALPIADGSVDLVLLPFVAHELRRHEERTALLRESGRAVRRTGRVVIAEHLRDGWGAVAFGPGVMHFHARSQWLRAASAAGLVVERETSVTPFARVFVLRRAA